MNNLIGIILIVTSLLASGCAGTSATSTKNVETPPPDQLLTSLKKSFSKDPKDPIKGLRLGQYYMKKKMWVAAESTFKKAIRANKTNIAARNHLGVVYYNMGNKRKALETWQASLDVAPMQFKLLPIIDKVRREIQIQNRPAPAETLPTTPTEPIPTTPSYPNLESDKMDISELVQSIIND